MLKRGNEAFAKARFAPTVWRVVANGATVVYHDVDGVGAPIRPPIPVEKPGTRWLAYGSSITNATPGYVEHAARHVGVDLYNKGLSGSCLCEPEVAAYLAEAEEWDVATLELGVNMRGGFSADQFESRARALIETIRSKAEARPMVLIDIFPNSDDYLIEPGPNTAKNRGFRAALKRIHKEIADPTLQYVDGDRILTSFSGLSADLIHPSKDGHQLMGRNLAEVLRELRVV